jgi:hypothetical protein
MQVECHQFGAWEIALDNASGRSAKTSMNVEDYRPDGDVEFYIFNNSCNPGGYVGEIN